MMKKMISLQDDFWIAVSENEQSKKRIQVLGLLWLQFQGFFI
jgi:hypothetical protein